MRNLFYDFQIDGKPILMPDEDLTMERTDLDAEDSGRDEGGFMHRIVVRFGMRTWSISYAYLTREEYCYMESLFQGKAEFRVDYRDDDGQPAHCIAYRSKHSITIKNSITGIYKNYQFNIIEC